MKDVAVRQATMADIDGLVASGSALFIEDGAARDRLRNPGWPREHALEYEKGNLADPNVLAPWRGRKVGAQLVERFRTWAEDRGAVQLRVTA
ncbi:hypothetical protein Psi01_48730 [Planobispora siamensis]|uniref:Uncharacterized protein n=1 Tax=Planobispora siamensis TaxID=936338 RepID=A0A8J3SRA2_9ACTN|nr:hypothetical protein Psi01_48730 [Planobispora siamensis]